MLWYAKCYLFLPPYQNSNEIYVQFKFLPKFYRVIQILLINIAICFPFPSCNCACLNYYWKKYLYVMRCAIWYHLHNLNNVKNTHGGVLLLVKLHALNLQLYRSNTPPWVFFPFFKLCTWYQIVLRITHCLKKKKQI